MAQREFTQHFPQPGMVEHDAEEIWTTQLATAHEALAKAGLTAADIRAIGITNQRETTVMWNRRSGEPIHRAIVWQDRRGEPLCEQLREQGPAAPDPRSTGLVIDPYFRRPRSAGCSTMCPACTCWPRHGELAFGTIDSWLLWKLTGGRVHATDVSNASRTMLFDIRHNVWDHELLKDCFHVPDSVLPRGHVQQPVFGETDAEPVRAAIPVAGMAGDQQSALFGQACFDAGPGQEHLRHRLLHADAHRRALPAVAQRPAQHRRGPARW
jgi:glycerol kinase